MLSALKGGDLRPLCRFRVYATSLTQISSLSLSSKMSVIKFTVQEGQKYRIGLENKGIYVFQALESGAVYYKSYMVWYSPRFVPPILTETFKARSNPQSEGTWVGASSPLGVRFWLVEENLKMSEDGFMMISIELLVCRSGC